MKVLLSWLREFAPDIDGDPVELGDTLSALGLAVEEMHAIGQGLDGVVLARVLDKFRNLGPCSGAHPSSRVACVTRRF